MQASRIVSKDHWKIYGPAIAVVIIGCAVAFMFVGKPPPKEIWLAAGAKGGAYDGYARHYALILARHGITVHVVESSGSSENLASLKDPASKVAVALVQSGMASDTPSPELMGLASLYFEPFWVFHRVDHPLARLGDVRGLRVAVGPEGSGTRALALRLFAANGLDATNTTYLPLSSVAGAEALKAGEVDVLCIVSSASSDTIRLLLEDERVDLFSFRRDEAYTRQFRFLSGITLPEGMIDLATNRPPHDYRLIGPAATLVAREELHPAIVDLLLQATAEVHGGGDSFAEPGQFPSPRYLDYPLSPDADRYFKHGPPFLQRFLPFWLATLVDRLKVMLLPLIVLLIPLGKVIPPTFRWRIRRKIVLWYGRLQFLDYELESDARKMTDDEMSDEINQIEREVSHVSVPLGYADQLYNLRLHIALIRDKINRKAGQGKPAS